MELMLNGMTYGEGGGSASTQAPLRVMVHWTNWLMGRPVAAPVVRHGPWTPGPLASPGVPATPLCTGRRRAATARPCPPAKVRMSNVFATENR
jgi:hypothetical protein